MNGIIMVGLSATTGKRMARTQFIISLLLCRDVPFSFQDCLFTAIYYDYAYMGY